MWKRLQDTVSSTVASFHAQYEAEARANGQRRKRKEHLKTRVANTVPWECNNPSRQAEMKRRMLALSADERIFLDKTTSNDVAIDMDIAMGYALAALKEDTNLERLRFKLVPQKTSDASFFRKYFTAVAEIRESVGASALELVELPEPEFEEGVEAQQMKIIEKPDIIPGEALAE